MKAILEADHRIDNVTADVKGECFIIHVPGLGDITASVACSNEATAMRDVVRALERGNFYEW